MPPLWVLVDRALHLPSLLEILTCLLAVVRTVVESLMCAALTAWQLGLASTHHAVPAFWTLPCRTSVQCKVMPMPEPDDVHCQLLNITALRCLSSTWCRRTATNQKVVLRTACKNAWRPGLAKPSLCTCAAGALSENTLFFVGLHAALLQAAHMRHTVFCWPDCFITSATCHAGQPCLHPALQPPQGAVLHICIRSHAASA